MKIALLLFDYQTKYAKRLARLVEDHLCRFCLLFCVVLRRSEKFIGGSIAALILIAGNVGVILALFPTHVAWTVYTLLKYFSCFHFSVYFV
ncbi:hypothetical protein L1887_08143 [Cichorium endivia]|nr:hypothetical protein L1887_08143 [Cichorium endivia]